MKVRKGDTVQVISGKYKGAQGQVMTVLPESNKVIVSGVNTASKHAKARRANDKAGIIDRDMPIDASNVMVVHKGRPVRVGYSTDAKGHKQRVARLRDGKGGSKTEVIS